MSRRDTVVTLRLRRKDLATAYLALIEAKRYPASYGQIVRDVFEAGVTSLIAQGHRYVENTDEAVQLLQHFKAKGNTGGRLFNSLALNIMDEEQELDKRSDQPSTQQPSTQSVQPTEHVGMQQQNYGVSDNIVEKRASKDASRQKAIDEALASLTKKGAEADE